MWYHPDLIIGECIDSINSDKKFPMIRRGAMHGKTGGRPSGHGREDQVFDKDLYPDGGNTTYPLWNAYDYRLTAGGKQFTKRGGHTGYNFHNFFDSVETLRNKYLTYGHVNRQAMKIPLGDLGDDLKMAVDCVLGKRGKHMGLEGVSGDRPIYFTEGYVKVRHERFREMVLNATG